VFGKTNLPILASDAQSYNDLFGTTNNPWAAGRTPGGSSGGAAAAVAAGLCGMELGSDLGGSIRMPCHWCGVYGLKPSYGLIPTRGHIPPEPGVLSDLEPGVLGPIARSAGDLDLALSVLAGPDEPAARGWRLELPAPTFEQLAGLRIGAWFDVDGWELDAPVAERLAAAVDALADASADMVSIEPVDLDRSLDLAERVIQGGMAVALPQDHYDELRQRASGLDADDRSPPARWARNITQTARDLGAAREEVERLVRSWAGFFDGSDGGPGFDAVICPVMRTNAIPHDHNPDVDGRTITVNGHSEPYSSQFAWLQAVGVARIPAVAAPVGIGSDGLPVGVQIVAPYLADRSATRVAALLAEVCGGYAPPPGV
jgi:amidase